jgi:lambda family phage portal protein
MLTNIVGENGVTLQSKARNSDGTHDLNANRHIEDAWRLWTKKGSCTVDGKLSFLDCQKLVVQQLAVDGECLVHLVRNVRNPFGFSLRIIDPDFLDEEYNEILPNGDEIRMGVEQSPDGKVKAYHLFRAHPHEDVITRSGRHHRQRISVTEILHIFRIERPGQTRGVPPMAATLLDMKQLDGYIEAELVAARVAASKMGFFTSEKGEEYQGEETDEDNSPIMNAEAGTFEQLPQGVNFQAFDPQHPTTQFGIFVKQILRSVAAGLNVSYASLSNDLESVNYSSIRQGALEERHYYKQEQQFLITHFLQPVFESWLLMAMTSGAVNLPAQKFEKFANPHWQPRGFGNIDPLKETQSHVLGLQNGLITLQDVAAIHGRDVETLFEQLAQERKMAESMGITLAFGGNQDQSGADNGE